MFMDSLREAAKALGDFQADRYRRVIDYIKKHHHCRNIYHLPKNPYPGSIIYVENEERLFVVYEGEWVEL